jgi:hypothetical protein
MRATVYSYLRFSDAKQAAAANGSAPMRRAGPWEQVAQENFQCSDFKSCMPDLNCFLDERMFCAKNERAFLVKGVSDPVSEAALRRCWADLQTAAARLGQ